MFSLILLFMLVASPHAAAEGRYSSQQLSHRIQQLSPFERHMIVVAVYTDISKNNKNLLADTPAHALDAAKVSGWELALLGELAEEAGWIEMSDWFKDNADMTVSLVRGDLKNAEASKQWTGLESRYQTIMVKMRANYAANFGRTLDANFASLRKDLVVSISSKARHAVWGLKPDKRPMGGT
jgi:hypothetical protein